MIRKGYSELLQSLNDENRTAPNYLELLDTIDWYSFRMHILERDKFTCLGCGTKVDHVDDNGLMWRKGTDQDQHLSELIHLLPDDHPEYDKWVLKTKPPFPIAIRVSLQAHHQYYVWNTLPWNYPDSCLQTLCDSCHTSVHLNQPTPLYKDLTLMETLHKTDCIKCTGTGYLPQYFYHKHGLCFTCDGMGFLYVAAR